MTPAPPWQTTTAAERTAASSGDAEEQGSGLDETVVVRQAGDLDPADLRGHPAYHLVEPHSAPEPTHATRSQKRAAGVTKS